MKVNRTQFVPHTFLKRTASTGKHYLSLERPSDYSVVMEKNTIKPQENKGPNV